MVALRLAATGVTQSSDSRLVVLVAVCNVVVRLGLAQVLRNEGHEVVPATTPAHGAPTGVPQPQAVLVCADECDMLATVEALERRARSVGVVCVVSGHAAEALGVARRLIASGAVRGFNCLPLVGALSAADVSAALRRAAAGELVLDLTLLTSLMSDDPQDPAPRRRPRLTRREREVLELTALGYRNSTIAEVLVISERAVEKTLNGIYHKLDLAGDERLNRRVAAARLWLEQPAAPARRTAADSRYPVT